MQEQVVVLPPTTGFDELYRRWAVPQELVILVWCELVIFFIVDDAIANWNRRVETARGRLDADRISVLS